MLHQACAKYVYPASAIATDMASLCRDMPSMTACSVHFRCQRARASGRAAELAAVGRQPATCDPFTLLVTTCKVDSMMKMKVGMEWVWNGITSSRLLNTQQLTLVTAGLHHMLHYASFALML